MHTCNFIKAGIKKVFFCMMEMFLVPKNCLKNGIEVYAGLLKKESKVLVKEYLEFLRTKPKATVKAAMMFDGKLATCDYDSKWITCKESRSLVHILRI
jgi:diaminohydroxyphosphoribosylaminopyrimidine deaminase/5-amino-6-(5-phosphoribosylamino)uracil reductase